jgi:hypothetical protein
VEKFDLTNFKKYEKSFEDYLVNKHAEQYIGTDDMMPDDYNDWLEKLDVNEVIEWVKDWFEEEVRNVAMNIWARKNEVSADMGEDFSYIEQPYDECKDIVLNRVKPNSETILDKRSK